MAGLTSAAPAAIDYLLAVLTTVATNYPAGLQVVDGQEGTDIEPNFVVVRGVAEGSQTPRGLGNLRREELFAIECMLNVYDGGDGPERASAVRVQAFALLELFVQAWTADPTFGGLLVFAQLEKYMTRTGITNIGGWAAQIDFYVGCRALIQQ